MHRFSLTLLMAGFVVAVAALLAAYVSGQSMSDVAPALAIIALIGVVTACAAAFLRMPRRSRNDLLLKAGRLFDSRIGPDPADIGWTDRFPMSRICGRIDGREAEFSLWLPRDFPPEMPRWAAWLDTADDDREPAFGLRISCNSPVEFSVKKWGVSPGPPFRYAKLDRALATGDPVNFTTKSSDAFAFWQSRADCRELAQKLIETGGVLQIGITLFDVTAWWPLVPVSSWSVFGTRLPSLVARLLELADAVEGARKTRGGATRKCRRCFAVLARSDAYCGCCGAPWWEEKPVENTGF